MSDGSSVSLNENAAFLLYVRKFIKSRSVSKNLRNKQSQDVFSNAQSCTCLPQKANKKFSLTLYYAKRNK